MQYTTHFNLNLPEGTDVVNPLVQDNPNYTAIDAAMFANKQSVIGTASEVASGTAHAITRSNTDSDYFRFTATSNWSAGDTMTVDGTPVTVVLSDGQTPNTGAYVINSDVLCLLNGNKITLIVSGKTTTLPASDIVYDNTASGIPSTNVQGAIDTAFSVFETIRWRSGTPNTSYNIPVPSLDSGNRAGLVFSRYGVWFVSVIDSGNQVVYSPIYTTTDSVRAMTLASYADGELTLNFSGALYGGITVLF